MDILFLIVHAKQMEDEKPNQNNREVKRARIGDRKCSNTRFARQCQPKFRQKFSHQGSSNAPQRVKQDRVLNYKR